MKVVYNKKTSAIRFWIGRLFVAIFFSFSSGYIPPTEFSLYVFGLAFFLDLLGAYFQWKFLVGNAWRAEFIYSILSFPWFTIWLLYLVWINTLNLPLLTMLIFLIVWAILIPIIQPQLSSWLYVLSIKVSQKPAIFFLLLMVIATGIAVSASKYVQVNVLAWFLTAALFAIRLWLIQVYVHATWSTRKIA